MSKIKKQTGFSLLEVLIAFAIIMISVVSLVGLHRFYIKAEASSTMRTVALQLAESKLDNLRTFDSVSAKSGVVAYTDIVTNSTGENKTLNGNTYKVSWVVTNNYLTSPANAIPETKSVTVNVGWVDNEGAAQTIALSGLVSRIVSVDSEQISTSSISSSVTPQVKYTPGDAPDVISVSLGNQLKQETTKPFPKVEKGNGSGVEVNFQNVTYNNTSNTQVLVDTSTVSCDCQFASSYTGGNISKNTTNPAQPLLVNNLLYWATQREEKSKWGVYTDSALVPKDYSLSATQSQTSICDACCENHFKGSGSALQDYYNPLNYTDTSKYNISGTTLVGVSSGAYIDSCRVMRLDGYYSRLLTEAKYNDIGVLTSVTNFHYGQLLPDWNLVKLNIMSYDFLYKSKNQESYVNYIKYVVGKYVKYQKENAASLGSVSNLASTAIQNSSSQYYIKSFKEWLPDNAVLGGDKVVDINDADSLDSNQLIARGIFIDLLPQTWLDSISLTDGALPDTELSKVSFSDVNLTLLVQWSPNSSSDSNIAYVSNDTMKSMNTDDYDSDYYGVYKRGELTIPKRSTGTQTITAKALRGNASIAVYRDSSAGEIGVTPYENDASNMITSTLDVSVNTALPSDKIMITGQVQCYDRTATTKKNGTIDYNVSACSSDSFKEISQPIISDSSDPSATCSLASDITGSSYRKLSCTVTKGASFTINFTKNGAALTDSSSSYIIKPYPLSFTTPFTDTTSSSTCIQIYDPAIDSTQGINLPKC